LVTTIHITLVTFLRKIPAFRPKNFGRKFRLGEVGVIKPVSTGCFEVRVNPMEKILVNEALPKYRGGIVDLFTNIHLSIRTKILLSFFIIILLMGTVNATLLWQILQFNRQYDVIITNFTTANSINGYIKPAIDTEMWNIVAGKTEFKNGKQYEIINGVNAQLQWMTENTDSAEAKIKLEVIRRTMKTLTHYVDIMGAQIARDSRVAENEAVLENIRGVSAVVADVVQEYVLFEVNRTEKQYQAMHEAFTRWAISSVILMAFAIGFSIVAAWVISRSIYTPIKKLHEVTSTITKNDLQVFVTSGNVDEIKNLGMSFNIMIGKIKELLDAKIKEQENLKKAELRVLQAQINPHFLYNTLDTIIWMAEANKTDQVVELVRAISRFFRITLSKGKDWISIHEEVEHIRSYLTIQKIRYRDILDYQIEVDETVLEAIILKLTLQPLVENSLYHGIKNKRGGGVITVRVKRKNEQEVLLEVEDNGIGFTPERLAQIQAELNNDSNEVKQKESGFGIDNVNMRSKLYYGPQYGLSVESEYQRGTRVSLVIPLKNQPIEK
jgi:two-component system sensor histidine kinase YesM